jgi:hypothetical protein
VIVSGLGEEMEEISMAASDWTAEMYNIVTSAALIIGGVWAGYKWGYTEWQRKRREDPDLDGTLTASSVSLPADKAYLTLQAAWRNPGPLPVWMCPEHSFVEQYELPGDPPGRKLQAGACRAPGRPPGRKPQAGWLSRRREDQQNTADVAQV